VTDNLAKYILNKFQLFTCFDCHINIFNAHYFNLLKNIDKVWGQAQ